MSAFRGGLERSSHPACFKEVVVLFNTFVPLKRKLPSPSKSIVLEADKENPGH
jgi:hypothetical protein